MVQLRITERILSILIFAVVLGALIWSGAALYTTHAQEFSCESVVDPFGLEGCRTGVNTCEGGVAPVICENLTTDACNRYAVPQSCDAIDPVFEPPSGGDTDSGSSEEVTVEGGGDPVTLDLGDRVKNLFTQSLVIGAVLALGIIVYAGISYTISAGNASKQKNAKEWIWAAVTGLLLLFGSFVILSTINISLTEPRNIILTQRVADVFDPSSRKITVPDQPPLPEPVGPGGVLPIQTTGNFWCVWSGDKCQTATNNTCQSGYTIESGKCGSITDSSTCLNTSAPENQFQCVATPMCAEQCKASGKFDDAFCEANFPPCPKFTCPVTAPHSYSDTWGGPRPNGRVHNGVDIFAEMGSTLVAAENGVILNSPIGCNNLGGWRFWLKGDSGRYYYYAHVLDDPRHLAGKRVTVGESISRVDTTGRPTGGSCRGGPDGEPVKGSYSPHLHLGVTLTGPGGRWIWPTPVADELGCTRSR